MKYSILLSILLVLTMAFIYHSSSSPVPSAEATLSNSSNVSDVDKEAIIQTARDYMEGWYEGIPERMDRSLHPDLVKRRITNNRLEAMTRSQLVGYTNHTKIPGTSFKITVFDVYANIADVKIDSTHYMDYLQMGKINGRWVIVNVLWASKK